MYDKDAFFRNLSKEIDFISPENINKICRILDSCIMPSYAAGEISRLLNIEYETIWSII